jgi:predicted amidohydrolase
MEYKFFKVALLQISAHKGEQDKNLEKGDEFCRKAAQQGADIALFPEMWNVGYERSALKNPDLQLDGNSDFIKHFKLLALELNMAIAITYMEKWDGGPRNTISIIDRHGKIVLTYAKVHTCVFDESEVNFSKGDDFYVCNLDTKVGNIKIGAMICYDREIPESARILMLKGAEIIIVPNACCLRFEPADGLGDIRLQQTRARAFENMVGVAVTNYPVPMEDGGSCAFKASGEKIMIADEKEGCFIAEFNLDELREWRNKEIWGNSFRQTSKYGLLTSSNVEEPFIRKDYLDRELER